MTVTTKEIKVLIIDDSALVRSMFRKIFTQDPRITVVGTAIDPIDAQKKITQLKPDVLTLDIEMPKMDGISFLEKIMSLKPMPVLMVSTLTTKGAEISLKALDIGAVDYIPKPLSLNDKDEVDILEKELIKKVKLAAIARPRSNSRHHEIAKNINTKEKPHHYTPQANDKDKIIAVGASTGGVEALRELLNKMPDNIPPVVVAQHMPAQFTKTFAARLDKVCHLNVVEATDGTFLESGNVYVAPGDSHLLVDQKNGRYVCQLDSEMPKVSGHKPSVDVLFDSVAKIYKGNALGVILTGMGQDGAQGMLEMKKAGAYNIGQNADSCVVYGMPKAAKIQDAVHEEIALEKIALHILNYLTKN
ncbi:MAG: chemotaxis response regulator protein-glutamate methylesterase [Pseudomonadota bacterium]